MADRYSGEMIPMNEFGGMRPTGRTSAGIYDEPTAPVYQETPLHQTGGFWGGVGQILYGSTVPGAQAFLVSGLITLGGSIINAIFKKKEKIPRSAQDIYFSKMTRFYENLGKRSRTLQSVATAVTGKAVPELNFNFKNAWDKNGIPDSIFEGEM